RQPYRRQKEVKRNEHSLSEASGPSAAPALHPPQLETVAALGSQQHGMAAREDMRDGARLRAAPPGDEPLEGNGSIGGLGHRVTRVWGDDKPGGFFLIPRRNLPDSDADPQKADATALRLCAPVSAS